MSMRRGPRVARYRADVLRARRPMAWSLVLGMILAACGSVGGSLTSPGSQPASGAASVAASTSPSATAQPTESPSASTIGGSGSIALAGLSSVIDKPAQTIDPTTFATSFASETPAIYVLYQLSPGGSGKVVSTWKKGDVVVNTFSLDYPADAPWAYFELTYQQGFIPGDYEEVLTLLDTGATITLPFTVTGPRKAPASPTPVPSGTSAFTLLSMATFAEFDPVGAGLYDLHRHVRADGSDALCRLRAPARPHRQGHLRHDRKRHEGRRTDHAGLRHRQQLG